MCDRYGGALAWDRHCAEREAACEAMRRSATCADCAHGHVFNGGVGDAMRAFDSMLSELRVIPKSAHSAKPIIENARQAIADACDVWVCDADGTEEIERAATPSDSGCDWFEPR